MLLSMQVHWFQRKFSKTSMIIFLPVYMIDKFVKTLSTSYLTHVKTCDSRIKSKLRRSKNSFSNS